MPTLGAPVTWLVAGATQPLPARLPLARHPSHDGAHLTELENVQST